MPQSASGPRDDLTALLRRASEGNRAAFDALLPHVYDELKSVAHRRLAAERQGHTLNTTALVHETYFKLVEQNRVQWQSRAHFFAIAARAMRRILIDYARKRNAERRGGGAEKVSLEEVPRIPAPGGVGEEETLDLIALDDALDRLEEFNARGAEVVLYRYFGGLTHRETAEVLGVSEITVRRAWTAARAWLRRELVGGSDGGSDGGPDDGPAAPGTS